MPISDDIKEHYPDDWGDIRTDVLGRATVQWFSTRCPDCDDDIPDRHLHVWQRKKTTKEAVPTSTPCCEWCGRPNGVVTAPTPAGWVMDAVVGCSECGWMCETDIWVEPDEFPMADELDPSKSSRDYRHTRCVLTIAHLDQDPRIADPDRLRALCQRCHLKYDNQPEQRAKRRRIYAELRGQMTLLEEI